TPLHRLSAQWPSESVAVFQPRSTDLRDCLLAHLPGLRILAARRELRQLVSWHFAMTSRPMKYSLRSLMIFVAVVPPLPALAIAVATYLFNPPAEPIPNIPPHGPRLGPSPPHTLERYPPAEGGSPVDVR